ncbi:sensor histidine kinase [Sphingosinicella sp. CPCC 101087]|uniref:sensor histidine kinase n=1 Tax=Sphingosinicella sp. CPCC 101087 TaxID=2497754 RepID=UPI0013EDF0B5|nr:histidine kinase dimerization/phosphoacceptor domain -containing protein [Sphingosinicella sp. CPCC 101087]
MQAKPLQKDDILITPDLYRRLRRPAQLEAELDAYRELSSLMTVDPELAIHRFLEIAIELCPAASSAGLSELVHEGGEYLFRWTALSGALAQHVGGTTPRDFSPCGLCLDQHHTILVECPARAFPYFEEAAPAIVEGLIVPLYDTGKRPLGTLWVTSHDPEMKFDATDARVVEQLAVQLVLAIKLRRKAKVLTDLERMVNENDLLVQEVHHRVKNTIQMTSALLHLQQRTVSSTEARAALKEAQTRLLVLAKVYEALLTPAENGHSRDVDVVSLVETLMTALCDSVSPAGRISLVAECDPLSLSASEAVPIGLIVNEAVTNSLKHGFPDGRSGEIKVELLHLGNSCTLRISDNGCGFEKPARQGSLGMRLIQSLARQLGGVLEIKGQVGTVISVTWQCVREVPAVGQVVS